MPNPVNSPKPAVIVEYDSRGNRQTKEFKDLIQAKRFYTTKTRLGKNPTIKKSEAIK